jgi:AcrR family transcriptional regulator
MLLDAAGELMRDSGYAAVTSRRVAAKAGLKPQLVHYYFRTMDDLFLALFRRVEDDLMQRQKAILKSKKPLKALWELVSDRKGVVLTYEFVALANHRLAIRKEIARFGNRFRKAQVKILAHVLQKKGVDTSVWPPTFVSVLINSLARSLAVQDALGAKLGHSEALKIINRFIDELDAR